MSYKPFMVASFCEYYLHNPERLSQLSDEAQKYFWEQRSWHAGIKMRWNALIASNGEGRIVYADGSERRYTVDPLQLDNRR